jgi:hypothetical protein
MMPSIAVVLLGARRRGFFKIGYPDWHLFLGRRMVVPPLSGGPPCLASRAHPFVTIPISLCKNVCSCRLFHLIVTPAHFLALTMPASFLSALQNTRSTWSIGTATSRRCQRTTHIGLYRTDASGNKLDKNGATGSYNPALCFSGEFAIDQAEPLLEEDGKRLEEFYRTGL